MKDNELDQVEKLLKRVVDSRDGYADAHDKTTQSRHQVFIGKLAGQRQDFAKTIAQKLEDNDREVDLEGSFLADIHRFYMDIKHKMDSDDEELFEEIIRGEEHLLDLYDDTLEAVTTDERFKAALQKQRHEVAANLDLVRAKEEAA
jgi:uncharacterized protein (TIGR02284 family)